MAMVDYDFSIRQQSDGEWKVSHPFKRESIAVASTLDEALKLASNITPNGLARVCKKTGTVGFVYLGGAGSGPLN